MKYFKLYALLFAVVCLTLGIGQLQPQKPRVLLTKHVEAVQAAPVPEPTNPPVVAPAPVEPAPVPAPVALTDHEAIMQAANIDSSDWAAVNTIVNWESSWRTDAVEPTTGACGLLQELPCGKSGCSLSDTVCILSWGDSYVTSRYGGWQAAVSFHLANGWY